MSSVVRDLTDAFRRRAIGAASVELRRNPLPSIDPQAQSMACVPPRGSGYDLPLLRIGKKTADD
jgi:hypothetical protein